MYLLSDIKNIYYTFYDPSTCIDEFLCDKSTCLYKYFYFLFYTHKSNSHTNLSPVSLTLWRQPLSPFENTV